MVLGGWGPKIIAARARAGLSQSQFADLLDVTQATVSRWESGRQTPTVVQQAKLKPLIDDTHASQPVMRFVASSPFAMVLFTRDWTVLAMSAELVARNRSPLAPNAPITPIPITSMPVTSLHGPSLRERATAEMERAFATLAERGFFDGAPAMYRIIGRGIYLDGRPCVFDSIVSPVAIDGQIAALCQTRPLDERSFADLRQAHDLTTSLA